MKRSESGFALVLAVLTLLMLTFLGLTLATTTSTELQIAHNYKWGQVALYNAEAGLELAKRFLRQQTWSVLLPQARTVPFPAPPSPAPSPAWTLARPDIEGGPSRNFENHDCDYYGQGYGVVLDHTNFAYPFQNVSTYFGPIKCDPSNPALECPLLGSFTVWVRRPVLAKPNGEVVDDPSDAKIIVTAEGTAPYIEGTAAGAYGGRGRAVRLVQVTMEKVDPADCENDFTGQVGMGSLNANYDPCGQITAAGIGGSGVVEVNPNQ